MSSFRYGASFVDRATGLRFEAHHPASRPDRWRAYLEGLTREYARYGIGGLVDRRALQRGDGVTLFFVGVDANERVVAGLRCHGPLDDAAAAHALAEMAQSPEWEGHRELVQTTAPYGVVEMKGAWREMSGTGNPNIVSPMVRCCAHAIEWLGAEVLLAAVADRMEPTLASIGSLMIGTESSPFPDERYRTILTGMRRTRYLSLIDETQTRLLREEAEQLRRPPARSTTRGWRPVLLDVRHRADRQVLANLRSDPGMEVIELATRQLAELESLLPPAERELLEEPPLFVFYPWRNAVVRMLGPRAFSAVRLDRNRNRITRPEQERLRRQRVGVVGLSAGHAAAAVIALEGLCGQLRLADFDEVELTNLNRLPASVLDVGMNKAVVAARRIAELDPYLTVEVVPEGIREANVDEFVAGLDVLVEECDDIAMKLLVREVARREHVAVVMETSDRGMLDVERFDLETGRPPFHGLLGDTSSEALKSIPMAEKVRHVLAIVDPQRASARGAASLAEIGTTLSTWPQLGSEVALGGATLAAAVRRLGLGQALPSGRVRVDLDQLVSSTATPGTNGDAATTMPPYAEALDTWVPAGSPAPTTPTTPITPAALTASASAPADPVLAVVHAAAMAPSCGNGQPWRFELSGHELAIELERTRGCGAMDVRSRASYVGLGAALFNARVAAATGSRLGRVSLFPDGPSSDVVASLELAHGSDPELAGLYDAMLARCSNRRHGTPHALDLGAVAGLNRAATLEGASLHLITDRERLWECADILRETERIRFLTPALREETIRELRWPGEDASTGIDLGTLELSDADGAALELMRRNDVMELLEGWDSGNALGDYLLKAVVSSSAVAVVTAERSSPSSYVAGGSALERVWIEAQRSGLAVHAIGPAFMYAIQQADFDALGGPRWSAPLRHLSERFRELLGIGDLTAIALVLRLSHAPPPSARSRRLPLSSLLRRRGAPVRG